MSDIEFIGVVMRAAGKTYAFDLSGDDLDLALTAEMPAEEPEDITELGRSAAVYLALPGRVDIAIAGVRKSGAAKLFTYRIIQDGEAPFPARESAE